MLEDTHFHEFKNIQLLDKGWSRDQKYYAETADGKRVLLRISDISEYDKKKREFEIIGILSTAGIKMSQPIDFGVCDDGKHVYQILSWCDGQEAKEALYTLPVEEQYAYGQKAARILKQMEMIERQPPSSRWRTIYRQRVERNIALYENCGVTFPDDGIILDYLRSQDACIGERPTALMHEDFQTDNTV